MLMTSEINQPKCRIYLISPPSIDINEFPKKLRSALKGGDVACLQLRLKNLPDDEVRKAAEILIPICHELNVAFIVNDNPVIAAEVGADGVHIGTDDAKYNDARKIVGDDAIVGVSCYDSKHQAMVAAEQGADYVAFGAFYPTKTKKPLATPSIEILSWWNEIMVVPSVAIGGINPNNCGTLINAGTDFIAVVGAVWDNKEGPEIAVKKLNDAIASS